MCLAQFLDDSLRGFCVLPQDSVPVNAMLAAHGPLVTRMQAFGFVVWFRGQRS